jgi:hypothetical protein
MLSGMELIHIKLELMDIDHQIVGINDNITSVLYMLDGLQNTHVKVVIRDLGLSLRNTKTNISNLDNRVTVLENKPDYSNDISNINNDIANLDDNMSYV